MKRQLVVEQSRGAVLLQEDPPLTAQQRANAKKWKRVSRAARAQVSEDAKRLKAACGDSNLCMVLGTQDESMSRFTDGFQNLHYLAECTPIGTASVNGFAFAMTFLRKGYTTHAVLKSSRSALSDNLMYEYRVGLFLNTKLRQLPNFVATHAAFTYASEEAWKGMAAAHEQRSPVPADRCRSALRAAKFDMDLGCRMGTRVAVLVQNIHDPISLFELLRDQSARATLSLVGNILPVLFQVYFALHALRDEFTHYDLHTENVLLYEPSRERHVEFEYRFGGGAEPLQFRSRYIAKIVDYGRSYFQDRSTGESSRQVQEGLPTSCGGLASFAHYLRRAQERRGDEDDDSSGDGAARDSRFQGGQRGEGDDDDDDDPHGFEKQLRFYLDSDTRNRSHDLRLLHRVRAGVADVVGHGALHPELTAPIRELIATPIIYKEFAGTPEARDCGGQFGPDARVPRMCTVSDAAVMTAFCLRTQAPLAREACFASPPLGKLTIHHSGANFQWEPEGIRGGRHAARPRRIVHAARQARSGNKPKAKQPRQRQSPAGPKKRGTRRSGPTAPRARQRARVWAEDVVNGATTAPVRLGSARLARAAGRAASLLRQRAERAAAPATKRRGAAAT